MADHVRELAQIFIRTLESEFRLLPLGNIHVSAHDADGFQLIVRTPDPG
jgi:hypothetical protein